MRIAGKLLILSERQKMIAYAVAALFLLVGVYFALSGSVVHRGTVTAKTIAAQEELLSRNARQYADRDSLQRVHTRAKPFFLETDPDAKKVFAGLLRTIETVSRGRHLAIQNLMPSDTVESTSVGKVYRVAYRAEGSADDIFMLFRDIDASGELLAFDTFSVSSVEGTGKLRVDGTIALHRVVVICGA